MMSASTRESRIVGIRDEKERMGGDLDFCVLEVEYTVSDDHVP